LSLAGCSECCCCDIAPNEAKATVRTNSSLPVTRMLDTLSLASNEVGSFHTQAS
jgi:hypothetical protein